jgi:hypothetical protein
LCMRMYARCLARCLARASPRAYMRLVAQRAQVYRDVCKQARTCEHDLLHTCARKQHQQKVRIFTHTPLHAHSHTLKHTHLHTRTHMHTPKQPHTIDIPIHMQPWLHPCARARSCVCNVLYGCLCMDACTAMCSCRIIITPYGEDRERN